MPTGSSAERWRAGHGLPLIGRALGDGERTASAGGDGGVTVARL